MSLSVLSSIWNCAVLTKTNHIQIIEVKNVPLEALDLSAQDTFHLVLLPGKTNSILNFHGMITCAEKNSLIEYRGL